MKNVQLFSSLKSILLFLWAKFRAPFRIRRRERETTISVPRAALQRPPASSKNYYRGRRRGGRSRTRHSRSDRRRANERGRRRRDRQRRAAAMEAKRAAAVATG